MLGEREDLYIPADERQLRRIQRRCEELDSRVRSWAQAVLDALPKNLSLSADEAYVLSLFLAQQRRLNLQMDEDIPDESLRARVLHVLGFEQPRDPDASRVAHRTVSARLESEIERACTHHHEDYAVDPASETAIDWRVGVRFMAQALHNVTCDLDLHKVEQSPVRFQLAVMSREMATAIVGKRNAMLAAAAPEPDPGPVSNPAPEPRRTREAVTADR